MESAPVGPQYAEIAPKVVEEMEVEGLDEPPSVGGMATMTGGKTGCGVGMTMLNGKCVPIVGSKAQVFHGNALRTSGRLKRKDLMQANGRIKSRKQSAAARKTKNLGSFLQKKGSKTFGPKKSRRRVKSKRGKTAKKSKK